MLLMCPLLLYKDGCLVVISGAAVEPFAGGVVAIANVVLNDVGGLQSEYDHNRFLCNDLGFLLGASWMQ